MARYLISLDSAVYTDSTSAQSAIAATGASVTKTYMFALTYEVEATSEQLASIAGLLESIDANTTTTVAVQAVSNQNHLTHLALTSDPTAVGYTPTSTGAGSHVYLVDTGLYADHEQFVGRNINNLYSNFNGDFADNAGHGTAVASVIIGNTQGVAKDATLHVVKLFDSSFGSITVGEILDALDAVLVHHQANTPTHAKVVCLPWTTPQNNFLDNKITEMNANNLVVVAAAGNDGVDVNTVSPAGVNSVITVGAYNENYEVTSFTNVPWSNPTAAYFSNYGAALDIFTLGVNVSVAVTSGSTEYDSASGTSISSGIVAGAVAQWINLQPTKTSSELKDIILQEGHLAAMGLLQFDQTSPVAAASVYKSLLLVPLTGEAKLGNLPSGRVLDIQFGQSGSKDLELNLAGAVDFSTLDFAPLPPWASIDFSSGMLTVDTATLDPTLSPGIYLFGIKATVGTKTVVEEYSIGIYNTNPAELDEASQFYYDTDIGSYDEVIGFQVAPVSQK